MVHETVRFHCDKCRKDFSSHDAAYDCEIGHITDAAISGFRADLDLIFERDRPTATPESPSR